MTTKQNEGMIKMRYSPDLENTYDLEFPLFELEHAIGLCGWTAVAHIQTRSNLVLSEIERLEKQPYVEIPDGKEWFKKYGKRVCAMENCF